MLVALPADNYVQFVIFETMLNGITIVGSIVGARVDLAEVMEPHPRRTRSGRGQGGLQRRASGTSVGDRSVVP